MQLVTLCTRVRLFVRMSDKNIGTIEGAAPEEGCRSWMIVVASSLLFCMHGFVFFSQGKWYLFSLHYIRCCKGIRRGTDNSRTRTMNCQSTDILFP